MGILKILSHEGVQGIRAGRYGGLSNTAVWFYRIGDTLIDTGCPNQWRFIRRYLQENPGVKQALVSHHHEGASMGERLALGAAEVHSTAMSHLSPPQTTVGTDGASRTNLAFGFVPPNCLTTCCVVRVPAECFDDK